MAVHTDRVTVGATAVELTASATDSIGGSSLAVMAPADGVLYVGGPDVTVDNGWPVQPGSKEAFDLQPGDRLYAVLDDGSADVHVIRTGI